MSSTASKGGSAGASRPLRRSDMTGHLPPLHRAESARRGPRSKRTRWVVVVAFAIAMAFVEAASVLYIRQLVDRIEPYQPNPLPMNDALGNVELWREAAT